MPVNLASALSGSDCLQCLSLEQVKITRLWILASVANLGDPTIGFDPKAWTADPRFNCLHCFNIPILTTWAYIGTPTSPSTLTLDGCLTCLTEYQLELAKTSLLAQSYGFQFNATDPTNGNPCLNCASAFKLDLLEAYLLIKIIEQLTKTTLNLQQIMDFMRCDFCLTFYQLLVLQVQSLAE